jgi:hypothetical protein
MRRLLAVALALTCVIGSTPSFARGGGHGHGGGGLRSDPTLLGAPAPQIPTFENRIPAPLPAPAQAPTINGPVSQPALR